MLQNQNHALQCEYFCRLKLKIMALLHTLFGIFGFFTSFCLFALPMARLEEIERFSILPYVFTLLNCLMATWYGLQNPSERDELVLAINGIGVVFEWIWVGAFIIKTPDWWGRSKIFVYLSLVLSLFTAVALTSLHGININSRMDFCRLATAFCSVAKNFICPVSTMYQVIRTESVERMQFFPSLFAFLSTTSWLVYGALGHDPFLYVPNAIGSLLGAIHLILYAWYWYHNRNPADDKLEPLLQSATEKTNKDEDGVGSNDGEQMTDETELEQCNRNPVDDKLVPLLQAVTEKASKDEDGEESNDGEQTTDEHLDDQTSQGEIFEESNESTS